MTLKEMKQKTLRLIEEINEGDSYLTDDPDISAKINDVINQIQNELSRLKKIPAKTVEEITNDKTYTMSDEMYQVFKITGSPTFDIIGKDIIFPEDFEGEVTIYYYKYPERITDTTEDSYEFELSDDALEIMPYGVAADLLKSDVSNAYGNIYAQRYEQMKQQLDSRYNMGFIEIGEGI